MSIEKQLERLVVAVEIIAAAQVAQTLALGKFVASTEFDADALRCSAADLLERLGVSPRTTIAPSQPGTVRVQEAITQYVQMYQGFISHKHTGKNGAWITPPTRRRRSFSNVAAVVECHDMRARCTVESDNTLTLCLPVIRFREWALERDIHSDHIKQWAKENNISQKQERIAPNTDAVSCFLIPGMQRTEINKTK